MSAKADLYRDLASEARGLFEGERDFLANAANLAALLYLRLPDLNWAGFYFLKGDDLVLGPFQGLPACVRIPLGKGVCGAAARDGKTITVPDVHAFPGHIACDAASNAELVTPLCVRGKVIGVLDLDSPTLSRFDAEDAAGIEALAMLWYSASDL